MGADRNNAVYTVLTPNVHYFASFSLIFLFLALSNTLFSLKKKTIIPILAVFLSKNGLSIRFCPFIVVDSCPPYF